MCAGGIGRAAGGLQVRLWFGELNQMPHAPYTGGCEPYAGCIWAYVGVYLVWFSVVDHMMVYVGVCGCMCGVVQRGKPYVGVCGCMWVYAWRGSVW